MERAPTIELSSAALQRVLSSEAFTHAENLRRLLAYLGDKSLNGSNGEVKEYTIGVEAFNKPPSYDPQQDAAVRVLASKLRHKLEDYYLKEGLDDPVLIELPKGHYRLRYQFRQRTDAESASGILRDKVRRWRRLSVGLGILAGALVLLMVFRWMSPTQPTVASTYDSWTPDLELIWRPYLQSSRPMLIALGTPLFAKFSGGFFRNPKINDWETAQGSDEVPRIQEMLRSRYAVPWHNFTGVGEATGAFLLCKLLQTKKPNLMLRRSSVLSWEDIQQTNIIFLGSPKFNLHLKDIPARGDLVIEGGVIRNLRPQPGEQEEYRDVWRTKADLMEDYSLIHRLPGLHGRGEIMVLAASSTEGTWAAVEYVTEASHAKDLVSRLRLPSGHLPKSYQVLIRAKFKEQVPLEISYVTHRVVEEPRGTSKPSLRGTTEK